MRKLILLLVLLCASIANGQVYDQWIAAHSDYWSDTTAWTSGTPTSPTGALLSNGVTCNVVTAGNSCGNLILEGGTNLTIGGTGNFLIVTGTAYIGGQPGFLGGEGIVNVEGGDFTVTDLEIGTDRAYGQVGIDEGSIFVNTLTIGTLGLVNVDGGAIYIQYVPGSDPIATVRAMLSSSYAHDWEAIVGSLCSTFAYGNANYAIGYADSADPGNPASLPANTIKIMATLKGDANLDRQVDGTDFSIVVAHEGHTTSGWDQGDFEYTGTCTSTDFTDVITHLGQVSVLLP
jgi:hypothetical protein